MKLTQIKTGEYAVVAKLSNSALQQKRLRDIGLREGVTVQVVRRAPLSCPIEIKLMGFHLALRTADAEKISVYRLENENGF